MSCPSSRPPAKIVIKLLQPTALGGVCVFHGVLLLLFSSLLLRFPFPRVPTVLARGSAKAFPIHALELSLPLWPEFFALRAEVALAGGWRSPLCSLPRFRESCILRLALVGGGLLLWGGTLISASAGPGGHFPPPPFRCRFPNASLTRSLRQNPRRWVSRDAGSSRDAAGSECHANV
eukprot:GHVT01042771.1.p1 GENE.GHVT01042771.1~~GHVT01042771.1.p1  ORF type:complete len:177 (+),score=28.66 GHVT01042771.1:345-875(+)